MVGAERERGRKPSIRELRRMSREAIARQEPPQSLSMRMLRRRRHSPTDRRGDKAEARRLTPRFFDRTSVPYFSHRRPEAAMLNEPSLESAEINMETFKDVVQLSGFVRSQADIDTAVEVARHVDGVKSVKNAMRLK